MCTSRPRRLPGGYAGFAEVVDSLLDSAHQVDGDTADHALPTAPRALVRITSGEDGDSVAGAAALRDPSARLGVAEGMCVLGLAVPLEAPEGALEAEADALRRVIRMNMETDARERLLLHLGECADPTGYMGSARGESRVRDVT